MEAENEPGCAHNVPIISRQKWQGSTLFRNSAWGVCLTLGDTKKRTFLSFFLSAFNRYIGIWAKPGLFSFSNYIQENHKTLKNSRLYNLTLLIKQQNSSFGHSCFLLSAREIQYSICCTINKLFNRMTWKDLKAEINFKVSCNYLRINDAYFRDDFSRLVRKNVKLKQT